MSDERYCLFIINYIVCKHITIKINDWIYFELLIALINSQTTLTYTLIVF